ncbi:hypothetical protein SDC9_75534 [bioreactor metagenome]|uniref:Peptidase M56 domain-containing protein n=1 Tax=bioreactor metagenome TaxID=1076179 RepID=A0A644YKH0_9ZZZZ
MTEFLKSLAEVSAAMAAVIAALLLIKPLVSRRYAARWRYWVWLAVAVRLLLPFNVSLAAAPVHLAAPMEQEVTLPGRSSAGGNSGTADVSAAAPGASAVSAQNSTQAKPASGEAAGGSITDAAPASPSGTTLHSLTLAGLLFRIYVAGAAVFLLWQLLSRRRFSRYVRRWSVPPSPEQSAVLEAEKRALTVKTPVGLAVCPGVGGPMLTGLIHPVILLPGEVSHLSLVLRHELTHLRRRDLWYKLLLLGANAVHWFNPLVWLMVRAASEDLEMVCDDATVAGLDEAGHGAYGDAILSALKTGRSSPLSTGFRGGAKAVAERLHNLAAGSKKRGRAALTAAVLVVALAAGLVACGEACGSDDDPGGRLALFKERFAEARAVAGHYAALDMEDRETLSESDGSRRLYLCGHYRTKEELRAATAAVFTDSYAAGFYTLLDSGAFTEKDGNLYLAPESLYDVSPWNAGDTISFGGQTVDVFLWDTLAVTSADENAVTYSMEWYSTYPGDPEKGTFTLVKESGTWKFSECFYEDSSSAGSTSTPIDDEELGSLLAAEFDAPQQGDTWELLLSRPGDGCTLGVLRYASASHAGGFGNLLFGVFDNAAKTPGQPVIRIAGDKTACDLWWEEDAPDLILLPYTAETVYQGAEACSAGLLSFDGKTLAQLTGLPAAAGGDDVTLPDGAETMLDPARNSDFWQSHKAVLSCSVFEIFSRDPGWEAGKPEESPRQWVYEGCVPLSSAHPPIRVLEAARRYFEEAFLPAGPYPMSSSDYPIAFFAQVTDYADPDHPGALAYNLDLYDEDQGYLERLFLFNDDLTLLGVRSSLDYSLQFNSVRCRLGEGKTGLFGTPTATNYTELDGGLQLYSEWFGEDYSTGCDYTYDPDTGTYSLCNLVTSRLGVSTNRGKGAAIHIGSTLAELIEAYPELDTQFTPQTSCLTMSEPILGGSGCRIEFYFNPNGGLPEPREDTLKRTVERICIAAPEW